MKKVAFAIAVTLAVPMPSFAVDNYATPNDAVSIVTKAVKAVSANREGSFKEITRKDKEWIHLDLYPVVYDINGKCLAHGQNENQVGKDLIGLADADGKEFVKERVVRAQRTGKFWQDYKFTDPVTKKILQKSAYCEKTSDVIVCAGIYKR